tara:strand:- start:411 stop:734 length:324 start_codon:yes stop_codon:yes gene_type:complete
VFYSQGLFILFFPECFCWITEGVLVSPQFAAVFIEVNFSDVDGTIPFFDVPFVVLLLIKDKLVCLDLRRLVKRLDDTCLCNTLSFAGNVYNVVLLDFRDVGSRRTTP